MAQILVRNIPEDVKSRLRRRAVSRGVSLEREVRDILARVPEPAPEPPRDGMGSGLARKFAAQNIPAETWSEFDRNLSELRKNWRIRDVDFGE